MVKRKYNILNLIKLNKIIHMNRYKNNIKIGILHQVSQQKYKKNIGIKS